MSMLGRGSQAVEKVKDVYWRLGQPVEGNIVEAYWPMDGEWSRAKFITLPEDGKVQVKWLHDGSTSQLPSPYVRRPGDGEDAECVVPLKGYLQDARPDWTEGDLKAVVKKLAVVGIMESLDLFQAVQDDLAGRSEGVNALLKVHAQKTLAPKTLFALRASGERLLVRRQQQQVPEQPEVEQEAQQDDAQPDAPPRQQVARSVRALAGSAGGFSSRLAGAGAEAQAKAGPASLGQEASWEGSATDGHAWAETLTDGELALSEYGSSLTGRVRCRQGHVLALEPAPYDVNCDGCRAELDEGAPLWRCDACAFDLCQGCRFGRLHGGAPQGGGAPLPQRRPGGPHQPKVERPPQALPIPPAPPRTAAACARPSPPQACCPKGHTLAHGVPARPVDCCYCGKALPRRATAWSCALCGYDLCGGCHAERAAPD